MTDIFISYANVDRPAADRLAKALEARGWSVWWDHGNLRSGEHFDRIIENEISNNAKVVLVVWSQNSVESSWVRDEATLALDKGKLVPLRIDMAVLPMRFRNIHTIDLSSWIRENKPEPFERLVKDLSYYLDVDSSSFMDPTTKIRMVISDIRDFAADIAILKFAEKFRGADLAVAEALGVKEKINLASGSYKFLPTGGKILAHEVLLIGVGSLREFRYQSIREFSARALRIINKERPKAKSIALTLHGAGYGLDEKEASLALYAGLTDALQEFGPMNNIKSITIIEQDQQRGERVQLYFGGTSDLLLYNGRLRTHNNMEKDVQNVLGQQDIISTIGKESEQKPNIFVALPFTEKSDFDDEFYIGIKEPAEDLGFLCEWINLEIFIGDALTEIKNKIEKCSIFIGLLSGDNPDVYLQIGCAWGSGKPMILIASHEQKLHLAIKGKNCLIYKNIREMREKVHEKLLQHKSKTNV